MRQGKAGQSKAGKELKEIRMKKEATGMSGYGSGKKIMSRFSKEMEGMNKERKTGEKGRYAREKKP